MSFGLQVGAVTRADTGDSGATWATVLVPVEGGSNGPLVLGTVAQWAALPNSRIKRFLNKQYASLAALAEAVATEDVTTMMISIDSMGAMCWGLDSSGYPTVGSGNVGGRENINFQIRLPYSTSI